MLFFLNWPTKDWVNWRDFQNFSFSIIEVIEKRQKWQFFGSEWQISINVEDQIRLWRLYFWAWINRRGDTAIRYFRVGLWILLLTLSASISCLKHFQINNIQTWHYIFHTFVISISFCKYIAPPCNIPNVPKVK